MKGPREALSIRICDSRCIKPMSFIPFPLAENSITNTPTFNFPNTSSPPQPFFTMKYFFSLIALAAFATAEHVDATVSLYQDTACATPVPGSGFTVVDFDTCDTGPFQTGWSSAKVTNAGDLSQDGTITFYTKNDCGCPTCGSHGYTSNDSGCLTDFGFTANAIGYN